MKTKELFNTEFVSDIFHEMEKDMGIKTKLTNDAFIDNYKTKISKREGDFRKLRWTSEGNLLRRFDMSKLVIDYDKITTWHDVACGCGNLFETILKEHDNIKEITGSDAVDTFIDIAIEKTAPFTNVKQKYYVKNLYDMDPIVDGTYDLVTLSGVLQILDFSKIKLTMEKLSSLVKPGGYLWIDTFNYEQPRVNKRRADGLWRFKKVELEDLFKIHGFKNIDCKTFNLKLNIDPNDKGSHIYVYGQKEI